ncbi:39S ribosomal protein L30 [Nephila pilipes]|uniref:39S ribosomal protein L30 n=1 Tax=Nephila pilipes TaxID=299642 RepID=A0A8X6NST6_NEPPI|nr:39S ribosomal protein L30 [Nephila pilipes]
MAAQSKKDFEAIQTYNKLRKKPLTDTPHHPSELREAQFYFDKVKEYRKRSEVGFEPSKLFMVWRVATLIGRPMWEKEAIIKLGLADHKVKYAIVKNTASNNKFLWSIKHLIRVKPITFPDGFPTEEDAYSTFLKQTGELIVTPRLKINPEDLGRDPDVERKKLDPRSIREDLRLKWNQGYPNMY